MTLPISSFQILIAAARKEYLRLNQSSLKDGMMGMQPTIINHFNWLEM